MNEETKERLELKVTPDPQLVDLYNTQLKAIHESGRLLRAEFMVQQLMAVAHLAAMGLRASSQRNTETLTWLATIAAQLQMQSHALQGFFEPSPPAESQDAKSNPSSGRTVTEIVEVSATGESKANPPRVH